MTIFVLALLVGIEVIGKVPATLHTPLMSAANSIHGIVLAGALLIGLTAHNAVGYVLAFVAAFFAAANVVGGYVVTGRMLKMFRRKPAVPAPAGTTAAAEPARAAAAVGSATVGGATGGGGPVGGGPVGGATVGGTTVGGTTVGGGPDGQASPNGGRPS
ncbi:MAG: NAD(P) transhydrogenase subunit alpha [Streptosporangiaceae bacterium]|nr:NAD(P) transhydrogenase subunit alpha [Streptosporangiaceae bacterium]MBV9858053.1 NAD(P) transhydrogenase subunit alpha [Streptosporangiaceae bacterium]